MPSKKQEAADKSAPPAYWRITEAGEAAGVGWVAGTVVPAVDLAPQAGAMHVRGLVEPASDREVARAEKAADTPAEPAPDAEPAKE